MRFQLLELIGEARSPDALQLLVEQLRSEREDLRYWAIVGLGKLGTKEARRALWEVRSYEFATDTETEEFRKRLGETGE